MENVNFIAFCNLPSLRSCLSTTRLTENVSKIFTRISPLIKEIKVKLPTPGAVVIADAEAISVYNDYNATTSITSRTAAGNFGIHVDEIFIKSC